MRHKGSECLEWNNNNDEPNGHLFYVGGDLTVRRGMLPIIILEVGVTSHAQICHIVLGRLASFSLFIMFNLCACNFCENRRTITKISEST